MKNKRLIFLHLPKNAGASMNSILKKKYIQNEIFEVRFNADRTGNLTEFKEMPQNKRDNIKYLSGHFDFGLHEYFSNSSKYVSMMRHPVERTISFYNYIKRKKSHRLLDVVKNRSLIECVTEVKDFDVVNGQARKLSATDDQNLMLKKALNNIDNHFAFMGVQEHFEESMLLLSHKMGSKIGYLSHLNRADRSHEIDNELIREIEKLNQVDLELYEIMRNRFFEELKEVKYLSTKKASLRISSRIKPNYDKIIRRFL